MENRLAVSIACHYTGLCGQSINPGPHQRFELLSNQAGQLDQGEGGAELSCDYTIKIRREHFREAMHVLETNVNISDLDHRILA